MITRHLPKILVSACLLGYQVRYDGKSASCGHTLLKQWQNEKRLFPVCPEILAGLPTPRSPAEIVGQGGGEGVWSQTAKVINANDQDATEVFTRAAHLTLQIIQENNIKIAILKEGSPSCGVHKIYDGTFKGTKIYGLGVTASFLKQNGVMVFSDQEIDEAAACLAKVTSKSK